MSRPSNAPLWRWRRLIGRADEALWQQRLGAEAGLMIVEKPGRIRLALEVYLTRKSAALALKQRWGGQAVPVATRLPAPGAPVRVSDRLEIAHDEKSARKAGRLIIPYGMAFGSGEHATTLMLLRALARRNDLRSSSILDLGTGSGVLALAARSLGARTITATDFDAAAIRTARANERLNFGTDRVKWEIADAKNLPSRPRYSLIIANLYSEILIRAATRVARALSRGGEVWLSGVLRTQQEEVTAAYAATGLRLIRTSTRGKWIMQQWTA